MHKTGGKLPRDDLGCDFSFSSRVMKTKQPQNPRLSSRKETLTDGDVSCGTLRGGREFREELHRPRLLHCEQQSLNLVMTLSQPPRQRNDY